MTEEKKFSGFAKRLISLKNDGEQKQAFAERIGIQPTTLSLYLRGERLPRTHELIKIADTCGVSMEWLVKGDAAILPGEGVGEGPPLEEPSIIIDGSTEEDGEGPARRIGAKTSRRLGGRDLAGLAASYILEMDDLSLDDRGRWASMIQDMERDPALRAAILAHWDRLRPRKKT